MAKKRRRANGEGSIYKRSNGKWIAALTVRKLDGSAKQISRTAKSAEHARLLLHELKEEYRDPTKAPSQMMVGELVDRWFSRTKKKWDISTADNHTVNIEKRIKPSIGQRKISDMDAMVIEDWIEWMEKENVGSRTQQQSFGTLSAAFGYAVGRKIMMFNPCTVVDAPTYTPKEIRPFNDEEVKAILRETQFTRYGALFQLAFTTGMRQGEIFGLYRSDYDPVKGTIYVQRQAREHKGHVTIKPPKTKAGKRLISLTPQTREMLNALPVSMKVNDFLFTSPKGLVIHRNNFRNRIWNKLLKRLEIEHRGFHHVRHTVATTMLTSDVAPITVAGVLGHATVSTTLDVYAHYIPETSRVAADAMSSIGVKFG